MDRLFQSSPSHLLRQITSTHERIHSNSSFEVRVLAALQREVVGARLAYARSRVIKDDQKLSRVVKAYRGLLFKSDRGLSRVMKITILTAKALVRVGVVGVEIAVVAHAV